MTQYIKGTTFLFRNISLLVTYFILLNSCNLRSKSQVEEDSLIIKYLERIHLMEVSKFGNTNVIVLNNKYCSSCTASSISLMINNLKKDTADLILVLSKRDLEFEKQYFSNLNIDTTIYDEKHLEIYNLSNIYPRKFAFLNGTHISTKRFTDGDFD